jgi:hypothetical protein
MTMDCTIDATSISGDCGGDACAVGQRVAIEVGDQQPIPA